MINILSIASRVVSFLTTQFSYCNIKSIIRSKVTLTIPAFVCESQHKLLESPVMKVGHNTLILARHGSLHLWCQHLAGRAKEIGSLRQASVLNWRRQAWNMRLYQKQHSRWPLGKLRSWEKLGPQAYYVRVGLKEKNAAFCLVGNKCVLSDPCFQGFLV